MAIYVDIEKNFRGFSLRVKLESVSSAMGILGASGSGKSMTLRCIAGIETPDRGKIIVNGNTVFDSEQKINKKPQDRRIGYLFQNYALFPSMTVRENIGCGFRGNKKEKESRISDFIRRYQLEGLEKRYPAQLSGGQQQRVALARMMIGEPELILLDEPFSALDGYLKEVLQKDMQQFLKTYSGEMIMVTHSRDEAYRFCKELTLLKDGKVLTSGNTKGLFEHPGLVEAARLTGCRNFSRIERLDDHLIWALDWEMKLKTAEKVENDHGFVGIRGHWICPGEEKQENTFPCQMVEDMETTFEYQYLVKKVGAEEAESLWWMYPKSSFRDKTKEQFPDCLRLPPEHLMLLKE